MGPKTRQRLLCAVIIFCVVFIVVWWYQSPNGPGGRYKYGLTRVSWTNGAPGTGTLVLALSRPPAKTASGGKVLSFTPGLVVNTSDSLNAAGAQKVRKLLPSIAGQVISGADADAHTFTFKNITPPAGWPFANPSQKNPTWTATTTNHKGQPTSSISIIPRKSGA